MSADPTNPKELAALLRRVSVWLENPDTRPATVQHLINDLDTSADALDRVSGLAEGPRFYRTTYTFEVLSESPIGDCVSLEGLAEACDTGDCVGRFGETVATELTGPEAVSALYEFGSEPGFFQLAESGRLLRDHVVALLSSQGTPCLETALRGEEDRPDMRARVEAQFCQGFTPDRPIAGTWTDVSDNDAFKADPAAARFLAKIREVAKDRLGDYEAFRDDAIRYIDQMDQADTVPDGPVEAMIEAIRHPDQDDVAAILGQCERIAADF